MKRFLPLVMLAAAGGCEPTMTVETKLIGSDLCKIQTDKLTWSTRDTKETIHGVRRFNAKWDARCGKAGV